MGCRGGDLDSDGDCDAADRAALAALVAASGYDARGDVDTDGDLDVADQGALVAAYLGHELGRGALSSAGSDRGSLGSLVPRLGSTRFALDDDRWRLLSLGRWMSWGSLVSGSRRASCSPQAGALMSGASVWSSASPYQAEPQLAGKGPLGPLISGEAKEQWLVKVQAFSNHAGATGNFQIGMTGVSFGSAEAEVKKNGAQIVEARTPCGSCESYPMKISVNVLVTPPGGTPQMATGDAFEEWHGHKQGTPPPGRDGPEVVVEGFDSAKGSEMRIPPGQGETYDPADPGEMPELGPNGELAGITATANGGAGAPTVSAQIFITCVNCL